MKRNIYVNLKVDDLERSKIFFRNLGFEFDSNYTNENATCMILEDNIFVMLLKEDFFATFTTKNICNSNKSTEVILCISCGSREEVDQIIAKAQNAGAKIPGKPQDYEFMYGHSFEDPDGHLWELLYVDENKQQAAG